MTSELATLDSAEPTSRQQRDACIVLAGKALDATAGDWDAATAALRPVLEAIGVIPYDTAQPRSRWGRPVQQGSSE